MVQTEAQRTLLKSVPELWSEVSDPTSLERHLGDVGGGLRITATHDGRKVCWEGECASGQVELSPAGFGTRVRLVVRSMPSGEPAALGAMLDRLGAAHHRPFSGDVAS